MPVDTLHTSLQLPSCSSDVWSCTSPDAAPSSKVSPASPSPKNENPGAYFLSQVIWGNYARNVLDKMKIWGEMLKSGVC